MSAVAKLPGYLLSVPARIVEPYIIAFNSLPRIALVPLITMIFGFGLLAKVVLAWTIVFFIVPFIQTRFGAFIAGKKRAAA